MVRTILRRYRLFSSAAHAFQAIFDLPHEPIDCFAHTKPVIVPLRTLLSQLA
jgi:hypothetical protein